MIYEEDGLTLEVDVKLDCDNWAFQYLIAKGFEGVEQRNAFLQLFQMGLSPINRRERLIKKSKEFVCPNGYDKQLEYLEYEIVNGNNLLPFMSKRVFDVSCQDKLINDWGFIHFHLSNTADAKDKRFVSRSDHLLIAYIDCSDDSIIYFLQVEPHISSIWTKQELFRILADNWPEVVEQYRIDSACSLSCDISDNDYAGLRKANISSFIDLHDGRVYIGPNWGITTAGTSTRATIEYQNYMRSALQIEKALSHNVKFICSSIMNEVGIDSRAIKLKFHPVSQYQYMFELDGHRALVLVFLEDSCLWCIIGSDETDIVEKIKLANTPYRIAQVTGW